MMFSTFLYLLLLQCTQLSLATDLVWSDEFESYSLNTGYWNYETGGGGWGNFELQEYTDSVANVGVDGEKLRITAIRGEDGTSFTSGRINTAGKVLFKYGTLEARIKVPNVDAGLWPAFWTMGRNFKTVGWPAAGEMDIMEIGQGLAINPGLVNKRVIGGAHWKNEGNYATYATWHDFDTPLYLDYHTYKLDWTPTEIITTVDGTEVFRMDIGDPCTDCEEFHRPHYIVLNLAVGGLFTSTGGSGSSSSGGSSSSSGCGSSSSAGSSSSGGCGGARTDVSAPLPADMYVDYVRIYANEYTFISVPANEPSALPSKVPSPKPSQFPALPSQVPSLKPSQLPGPTQASAHGPSDPPSFRPSVSRMPSHSPSAIQGGASAPSEAPQSFVQAPQSFPYYNGGTSEGGGGKGKGKGGSSGKSSGGRTSTSTSISSLKSREEIASSAYSNHEAQTLFSTTPLMLFITLASSSFVLFCT